MAKSEAHLERALDFANSFFQVPNIFQPLRPEHFRALAAMLAAIDARLLRFSLCKKKPIRLLSVSKHQVTPKRPPTAFLGLFLFFSAVLKSLEFYNGAEAAWGEHRSFLDDILLWHVSIRFVVLQRTSYRDRIHQ